MKKRKKKRFVMMADSGKVDTQTANSRKTRFVEPANFPFYFVDKVTRANRNSNQHMII